jgi:hypothetical protein
VLEYLLHPQPGYPFLLELQVEYTLAPAGLTVRTTARNAGADPCPTGAGAHPYLTVGQGGVDEAVLRIPAATMLKSDDRGIPVGAVRVEGARDFRRPRPIGTVQLDHCFTELDRGVDGLARVELDDTTLWADERYPYLMVFTGDSLPDGARRSVAVEPMTCAPNAFASGDGLVVLEPGEEHAAAWGITPHAAARGSGLGAARAPRRNQVGRVDPRVGKRDLRRPARSPSRSGIAQRARAGRPRRPFLGDRVAQVPTAASSKRWPSSLGSSRDRPELGTSRRRRRSRRALHDRAELLRLLGVEVAALDDLDLAVVVLLHEQQIDQPNDVVLLQRSSSFMIDPSKLSPWKPTISICTGPSVKPSPLCRDAHTPCRSFASAPRTRRR